ncbi:hypothetical protein J6590_091877 [Homalodisca vitripennis]|nr:hypothetical protein J6590_091877 [Homalodisca vitripennis]
MMERFGRGVVMSWRGQQHQKPPQRGRGGSRGRDSKSDVRECQCLSNTTSFLKTNLASEQENRRRRSGESGRNGCRGVMLSDSHHKCVSRVIQSILLF